MSRAKSWTILSILVVGASYVFSQQGSRSSSDQSLPKTHSVSVVVKDPTGAAVPGAELSVATYVIGAEVGRKTTNNSGEADFSLQAGVTYKLSVDTQAFILFTKVFKLDRDLVESVMLQLGRGGGVCTACETEPNPIALEDVRLTIGVLEQPVAPFPLRTRRYRHSRH